MIHPIRDRIDARLLLSIIALTFLGLLSIYSAMHTAGLEQVFQRQLTWVIIGLVVLVVSSLVDWKLWRFLAYPIYGASIFSLVLVLLFGRTVYGSTSWLVLAGLQFQPSEFCKLATVLALARFLTTPGRSITIPKDFILASGFVLLPVILTMVEPDAGTALVFLAVYIPILYWAGASGLFVASLLSPIVVVVAALIGPAAFGISIALVLLLLFGLGGIRFSSAFIFAGSALSGMFVQFIFDRLAPHQQKRILTFLNPAVDPLGAGYNIIQAKIAVGSGGLFGKGFLHGTQTQLRFVPKQWTDFIFCVPGEEFGFVGAILILALFAVVLLRGLSIAVTSRNPFAGFVALGITSIIGIHVFVNIGMELGLLPVVGIPLPFLSYGGSFFLSTSLMMGLLLNLYAKRSEY